MPKNAVTIQTVVDRGLAMVVVDELWLSNVPCIGINERAAARTCAQHIKGLGRQMIGIVTFPLHADGFSGRIDEKRLGKACFEVARRRMQGYLRVIEPGGPKSPVKIWECPRSSEEDGRTAAEYFFQKKPRPTAILATSDRLALGVMQVPPRYQPPIPDDFPIFRFDDIHTPQSH